MEEEGKVGWAQLVPQQATSAWRKAAGDSAPSVNLAPVIRNKVTMRGDRADSVLGRRKEQAVQRKLCQGLAQGVRIGKEGEDG